LTPHTSPADQPRPSGFRLPAGILSVLCTALLVFVALVVLWLGQTSTRVYTRGADALVIRAVLRMNTDPVATENLAGRIRQKVPDIELEIINESMGRSLLALQEPWIAQMPDFEVTPLPTLIEMRHPALLTHPEQITQFVKELGDEPEVDFVAYNETAHDQLTKLAAAAGTIQGHTIKWILAALALTGFMAQIAFSALARPRSLPGIVIRHAVCGIAASVIGIMLFRLWENGAVATGDWERVTSGKYFVVGICVLAIMGVSATTRLLVKPRI